MEEGRRVWVSTGGGRTPRYLDELFKLLNVGLQLGLLDAQFLPAQVQSFHSSLKCLGVEEAGRSGGPLAWEPRKAPASSAQVPPSPGLPTFHPMPGSEQSIRGHWHPQAWDCFCVCRGNTEPPFRTPGVSQSHAQNQGLSPWPLHPSPSLPPPSYVT